MEDLKGKKATGLAKYQEIHGAKKMGAELVVCDNVIMTYARLGKWSYRRYRQRLLLTKRWQ